MDSNVRGSVDHSEGPRFSLGVKYPLGPFEPLCFLCIVAYSNEFGGGGLLLSWKNHQTSIYIISKARRRPLERRKKYLNHSRDELSVSKGWGAPTVVEKASRTENETRSAYGLTENKLLRRQVGLSKRSAWEPPPKCDMGLAQTTTDPFWFHTLRKVLIKCHDKTQT